MSLSVADYSPHDQQIWDEELHDFVPDRVFDALGPLVGLRVVDVGAGTGIATRALIARGADTERSNADDATPLELALQNGFTNLSQLFPTKSKPEGNQ